jgi:hypothetical protein
LQSRRGLVGNGDQSSIGLARCHDSNVIGTHMRHSAEKSTRLRSARPLVTATGTV